ncbi:MAG TPA: cytochrome o ubiquinol oxidase subunit III [Candidatus Saccharimonadia bacterium]|nr:cytochrome o ubiquinol oxidase subunit III [Candidatus Saccharimonadia bacterium]
MSEVTTLDMPRLEAQATEKTVLGFWAYLMTDCVLFASLFAVYAVLHGNTFGGPGGRELFKLPYVLIETMALLTSSFTCGLALLAAQKRDRSQVLLWLGVTFLLCLTFLGLELSEFHKMVIEGNSWRRSGFLSSYFTLVGTHGLHITFGLIWMAVTSVFIINRGLTDSMLKRLTLLSLFWHFLDIVWIFIFTIVYLFGSLSI